MQDNNLNIGEHIIDYDNLQKHFKGTLTKEEEAIRLSHIEQCEMCQDFLLTLYTHLGLFKITTCGNNEIVEVVDPEFKSSVQKDGLPCRIVRAASSVKLTDLVSVFNE